LSAVEKWKNKILGLKELSEMYLEEAGKWVLLEILGYGPNGQANRVRVVALSDQKDDLLDYMMEHDEEWDWGKKFVIVHADPKLCTLLN